VRAELAAGSVHAAIVPGSAEAVQALGGHMAALHTYLNEQRTPVETLTLAEPEGRAAGFSPETGQPAQGNAQDSQQRSFQMPSSGRRPQAPFDAGQTGNANLAAQPPGRAGTYISVVA
jgi:hypothetical protein